MLLRILNTQHHWACMVLKRGSTASSSQAVVYDGLFQKEIMDCAVSVTLHFMERSFDKPGQDACVPEWGRVEGQNDKCSCGHRIVIVFDALASSRQLSLKSPMPLRDFIIGPDKFKCLGSKEEYVLWDPSSLFSAPRPPATPQRQVKRTLPDDMSPPGVQARSRRFRADEPLQDAGDAMSADENDTLQQLVLDSGPMGRGKGRIIYGYIMIYICIIYYNII